MKLQETATTTQAAALLLPKHTGRFFKAGRKAFASGDADDLHQFRIAAKRFRYALEIFAPVYGTKLNARLESMKELQDLLGKLNDLVTARELLSKERKRSEIMQWISHSEKETRQSLEQYWQDVMNAPGEEESWKRYLSQFAARGSRQDRVLKSN